MRTIRYISLFSGIEAATVAWQPLGWKPIAYAEVEPFPLAAPNDVVNVLLDSTYETIRYYTGGIDNPK